VIVYEQLPADIINHLIPAQRLLETTPSVVFAYLFGGLARGAPNPLSDVDIAVYFRAGTEPGEEKLALFDALTDALGTSELDLVILNRAPISLVGRVLQNNRCLIDKEPLLRHRFESAKRREYFDFRIKEDAFFKGRYEDG
jgi:predicted nucleotidyltransferase